MLRIRASIAAIAALSLAPIAIAQDAIEMLPLGDPERAYKLASGLVGETIDGATGETVGFEQLIDRLADAEVIILGERHTSGANHDMQARLVSALGASGEPGTLGVAMEFFTPENDDDLAAYAAGRIDLPGLVGRTGWYDRGGYSIGYYTPIIDAARGVGAPVVGANVPRDWVRAFSRGTTDTLTEDQLAAFGPEGGHSDKTSYVFARMIGGAAGASPMVAMMSRGQEAWDRAMSTSVLRLLDKPGVHRVVLIVGGGHAGHGLGIPEVLLSPRPDLRVRTVMPVFADPPDPDAPMHPGVEPEQRAAFSLAFADFTYVLAEDGGAESIPNLGIRVKDSDDGAIEVTRAGSIGKRAGIQAGDVLLTIDQRRPRDAAEATYLLRDQRWDTRIELRVTRDGEELLIPVLVTPPTDGMFDWLESEPLGAPAPAFDPLSPDPIGAVEADGAHRRLVTHLDRPHRVDVVDWDGCLVEAWLLDDKGRPRLGLLRQPRDGAVRVEIERDEDGSVLGVMRRARDGSLLPDQAP